jgi:choline dehydrogenase-like flavoprotein
LSVRSDPFEPPIIQTNYLVAELDRRVVVAGMKLARRLLKSAPLAPYYAHEDFPGPDVQTDDEFLAAATKRGTTTVHPAAAAGWARPTLHGLSSTTSCVSMGCKGYASSMPPSCRG